MPWASEMLTMTTSRNLSSGYAMPLFGLGVFRLDNGAECERQVRAALDLGYRHIDTARGYGNEVAVGRGIRASGVPREEIFVTTKVMVDNEAAIRQAVEESATNLDLGYIDLYLLHWPKNEWTESSWELLREYRDRGVMRTIGVSNFSVRRFQEQFLPRVTEVPAVNQIERHPRYAQPDLVQFNDAHHIATVAYSPLARGAYLDDPVLVDIAQAHGKTVAQVMIRWQLQQGVSAIPKSASLERLKENADVFDFALSDNEMERIDALDRGESCITWRPEPDWF